MDMFMNVLFVFAMLWTVCIFLMLPYLPWGD